MTLSETQRTILRAALQHPHLMVLPSREAVRRSLLGKGMIEAIEVAGSDVAEQWPADEGRLSYRITEAGLRAIAEETSENTVSIETTATPPDTAAEAAAPAERTEARTTEPVLDLSTTPVRAQEGARAAQTATVASSPGTGQGAPVAAPQGRQRVTLRVAAQRLLAAFDAPGSPDLAEHVGVLRACVSRASRDGYASTPRGPRSGTKQEAVIAMLRRPEGASVAQVAAATAWAPHTVRGFFAGLKKRQSLKVEAERIRQVGQDGAKGSYSIYRIKDVG